jgi:hypothetical protein
MKAGIPVTPGPDPINFKSVSVSCPDGDVLQPATRAPIA